MRWTGIVIGVLVMLGCAVAFVSPRLILSLDRSVISAQSLYAIAALRIILGLIFVLTARASRWPWTLRALGLFVIIAGLTTPGFGVARTHAVMDWMANAGPPFVRLAALGGMAIGGFLVFAYRSRAPAPAK